MTFLENLYVYGNNSSVTEPEISVQKYSDIAPKFNQTFLELVQTLKPFCLRECSVFDQNIYFTSVWKC